MSENQNVCPFSIDLLLDWLLVCAFFVFHIKLEYRKVLQFTMKTTAEDPKDKFTF